LHAWHPIAGHQKKPEETMLTRRQLIQATIAAGPISLGAVSLGTGRAGAQGKRELQVNIVANSLGVHIPYMAALTEILPAMPGFALPEIKRVNSLRIITQSILSGTVELAGSDPIGVLRAVEAGADLKIVGFAYYNTDLVFVVNAAKIKTLKDFERPDVTTAINSKGDFTHVLLARPMIEQGLDHTKVNLVEVGGSGARVRAFLAGRIDAMPVHIDQARTLAAQGDYPIIIDPSRDPVPFIGEIWLAGGAWLAKPENQAAVVALNKATIMANRRAHADFDWFAAAYRKYGTATEMKQAPDAEIRSVRDAMIQMNCWPTSADFTVAAFDRLLPIYKAAGAVAGTIDLAKVIDPTYAQAALKSLG
jgi:NitT/TauT family transport system substrate-binding protein